MESISYKRGFFWETLWNLAENAELKRKREDPNVLLAGDQVFIADNSGKIENCATEQRHRFKRKGVPSKLKLRFLNEEKEPRTNERYVLEVDGQTFSGTLNAEGCIEVGIPPNAKRGKIMIGDDEDEFELVLGGLDPMDEVSGVQARLNNLGFDCGQVDGVYGPATEAAVRAFQAENKIETTGKIDQQTRDKLFELYDNRKRKS
jgi:N-acetylmuramoyl-L-alanine amidase